LADQPIEQKLAAILVADVAGYSALMGDDERATVATLDEYRGVFRTTVAAHNGRVVDTVGDSVLAVFPSTIGAVRAATDGRRAGRYDCRCRAGPGRKSRARRP